MAGVKNSLWSKASKQFSEELMKNASGMNRNAQQILISASSAFLDYVQMNKELLPYYTANLHDSIATAVSQSGRIIRAEYMPTEATRPQTAPGRKRIIGVLEAERAVRSFRPNRTGVFATLFVSVPYAEGANQKSHHAGYFEWLESAFTSDMSSALDLLSMYPKSKVISPSRRRFDND